MMRKAILLACVIMLSVAVQPAAAGYEYKANKESSFYGQRWAGGWKLEGLAWSYKMDAKYMYQADIQKSKASLAQPLKRNIISMR